MTTSMSAEELLRAVVKLKPVDRVPICPMVDFFAARFTSTTMAQFVNDSDACEKALLECFERLGGWDFTFNAVVRDPLAFSLLEMTRMRLPGKDLPDDAVWQFDEQPILTVEDYDSIVDKGFSSFLFSDYMPRILPGTSPSDALENLARGTARMTEAVARWQTRGVPTLRVAGTTTPFEAFSKGRSLAEFGSDLYQEPERLEAAMAVAVTEMTAAAISTARASGVPGVFLAGSRGSGQFLSPRHFERFYLPYLEQMVNTLVQADLMPILHFDQDWTRNLEYFKAFPKGSCILQLDSFTDIRKAKDVLGNHMCIMGDVPPTLLTLGTPVEVEHYTRRLLEDVGGTTGFILSSGCSIPVDAKPDNVRAFIDVGKSFTRG